MKLQQKIAVVTGASRGIGRSIARAFADEGADLVVTARSGDQLETLAAEIAPTGRRVLAIPCDISDAHSVRAMADRVQADLGRIDILVNNAGISKRSRFLDYDDETWFDVIRVNLFGTYLCTKALLPLMLKAGQGRIINMSSAAGKSPMPFNTAYGASKHGVLGLTKSLASELALSGYPGITVNAICPFFVKTDMFSGPEGYVAQMVRMTGLSETDVIHKAIGGNLQQRVLEPEEVAAMAVYLASEEARGVTGQALNICGGRVFH